jgi:hypothetical protein
MTVRMGWAALVALVLSLSAGPAFGFCGFFVTAGGQVTNDASQVALMRVGTTTVLSMRNSYGGPPEDFALVVPVPVVLEEGQVRTLSPQAFDRLDQLTAPRLVEYWEQDPCPRPVYQRSASGKEGGTGTRAQGAEGSMGNPQRPPVRVEASYSVDEYDIVILSADDSTALEAWLKDNGYKMPPGIEPYLRPYVVGGSKFFVAKVDVKRVRFLWGRALLSPLRFHYDSERFALPIRLGLANAHGPQDLVVYLLSPGTRYEVANYDNVFAPTNLNVKDDVRDQFPSFYATLFDRTVAGKPRAVVTEYSWDAASCDPCPVPPLDGAALSELGADVARADGNSFVLTRLHARYSKETAGDDLVFRAAKPVVGGREFGGDGQAVGPGDANSYQARYIIRHPWKGSAGCDNPRFGVWGGPPKDEPRPPPPRPMVDVRRDLPLDALILAKPLSGAGKSPPAAQREVENEPVRTSWLAQRWRKLARFMRSNDSVLLSVGFVPFGLLVLIGVRRRRLKQAFAHGALFLLVAGLPLLLLTFRRGRHVVFDPDWGTVVLLVHVLAAWLIALLLLRARDGRLISDWWLPLLAMTPLAAGVAAFRAEMAALSELVPTFSPNDAAHALTSYEGRALLVVVLGAGASAVLLPMAALALWRPAEERASSNGLAVALGALIGAAGVAAAYWPWERLDGRGLPLLLAPLLLVASASLAWRLRAVPASVAGRRAHAANVAVSTFMLALAGMLATAALLAWIYARGLDSISGWGVVPASVRSTLEETRDTVQHLRGRAALASLSVLVPLLALLSWRWRAGDLRLGVRSALRMLAPLATLIALWLTFTSAQAVVHATHQPVVLDEDRLGSVADLELVPFSEWLDLERMGTVFAGPAVFVSAGGKLFGSATSGERAKPWTGALYMELGKGVSEPRALPEPLLMADRGLTMSQLQRALNPFFARQQTWFRWVFGDSKLSRHGDGMGVYADLATDFMPRRTLEVEWLPELRVRTEDVEAASGGLAIALRRAGDGVDVRPMRGGHGNYRVLPGSAIAHHPFSDRTKTVVSFDALWAADEVVLVIAPDSSVADAGALMLALVPDADYWGRGTTRPAPRFVISSDEAPFR